MTAIMVSHNKTSVSLNKIDNRFIEFEKSLEFTNAKVMENVQSIDSLRTENRELKSICKSLETLFIEVDKEVMNSQNSIIIYCTRIKPERKICHMIGDYNINLLNTESHPPTQDFLNCMYSNSLFPVITKPTKATSSSAMLIDNLFTNAIANAQSFTGILFADASDHFPIFYIDYSTKVKILHKFIRKRIYSPENLQKFTDACDAHEWNDVLASNGVQDALTLYHNEFTEIYKLFSYQKINSSYKYRKPWLSEGLRKSIEYKNKLYRVKMRSNSP